MSSIYLTSLVLGLGLAATQEADKDSVKGASVILQGCVVTDKENSFILTQVKELSGVPTSTSTNATTEAMSGMKGGGPSEVIYWLSHDSVKLMRGHLGHKVEVTGVITDLSTGTVRMQQEIGKPGPANDTKIEVNARDKEATGKTDLPVGSPPPANKTDKTTTMPVRRVKVDTVKMIAATCS